MWFLRTNSPVIQIFRHPKRKHVAITMMPFEILFVMLVEAIVFPLALRI